MGRKSAGLSRSLQSDENAFTIVELLVVIVVIAVLAAITIVSYTNITNQATQASLQSDLDSNKKLLAIYYTDYGYYPSTLDSNDCPTAPVSDSQYCLVSSGDNNLTYKPNSTTNVTDYYLYNTNGDSNYKITPTTSVSDNEASTCPYGYILVPGSTTYSTSDFCVAKYEMKIYGNDNGAQTYSSSFVPQSRASGTPWVNISQTNAISEAPTTVDAQGNTISSSAHLITEAEWMTIAQNVLQQPQNWSTGTIGSGFIYTGHSYNNPASALAADSNDANSLYGMTGGTGSSAGYNSKRTSALSNGEIIWDLSGNIWECTQGQITGSQLGLTTDTTYVWERNWKDATDQNGFPSISIPSSMASGALTGITNWTRANGIGVLTSYYGETATRAFLRSGNFGAGSAAGVLALILPYSPSYAGSNTGFRVVVPAS